MTATQAAITQTVNWTGPTPEMRRVNRQIVWHARTGRLWVLALLAALVLFDGLYLHQWWLAWGLVLCMVVMLASDWHAYQKMQDYGREIGTATYTLSGDTLHIQHNLATVSIAAGQIKQVLPFAGGIHVRYGKHNMLTLPAGPVQQALATHYGRN